MSEYHVYVLASLSRRLYIGVTNDLLRRIYEHKQGAIAGFTQRYHINRLVHYETTSNVHTALSREKQLKRWPRARKLRLIDAHNAGWRDLSADWFANPRTRESRRRAE